MTQSKICYTCRLENLSVSDNFLFAFQVLPPKQYPMDIKTLDQDGDSDE